MGESISLARAPNRNVVNTEEAVGLVAGWGQFPFSFAEKAKAMGLKVACVGLNGSADPALANEVWQFGWAGPAQIGRMIRFFRRHGVRRIVMAGKVQKAEIMYKPWKVFTLRPDLRGLHAWFFHKRRDNKDDSILLAFIDEFARDQMTFASALDLCPELLVKPGILTRRQPTKSEYLDIEFGWELAREMGRLDVGQSVAVKDRAVLAVEAIEGTDKAILRAGELCRVGGFTVVKVAKPNQDMRFDVPTVGRQTIETMHKARATVLAIEAGRTIFLEQSQTLALADKLGISIVSIEG